MFMVFNIVVIGLVLLIGYWWANQGLFSAILHLVCVITAGAITLAVWEPLTVGLLLRGTGFDDYAWGISFLGVFALSLLILRVIADKAVGANVRLPHWTSLAFGFPVGTAAGILTIGMVIIGAGFIQSTNDVMGFKGKARSQDARGKIVDRNQLWAPVHQWTAQFYSLLSAGSLYPTFEGTPMNRYYPDLDAQAASLVRDSIMDGRGKLSLRPADARIEDVLYDAKSARYAVRVVFEAGARDFGQQLTLSAAQVRLIANVPGNSFAQARTVHPDAWTQYDGRHLFDDLSHYLTSEPAQAQADVWIEFPAAPLGGNQPRFIQIRGTRYRLKPPVNADVASTSSSPTAVTRTVSISAHATDIQTAIEQSNSIRPIQASTNQKPSGIAITADRFISGGEGEFLTSGGERPSRNLMIQGIMEPEGTRIVQLDVSRESPANIFGTVRDMAGEDAEILLVDTAGRPYQPIGYIHQRPDGKTVLKIDFQHYLPKMKNIPPLPTSGGQNLRLLFCVTEGATVAGLKVGEVTVGTCNLPVRNPQAPPPESKTPASGLGDM